MKGKKLEFAVWNLLSIAFTLGVMFPLLTSSASTPTPTPSSTSWKPTGTHQSNFSTGTGTSRTSTVTRATPDPVYDYEAFNYIDDDTADNQNGGAETKDVNGLGEPLTVTVADPDKLLYLIIALFAVVSFAIVILVLSFRYLPRQDGDSQNGSSPFGNDMSGSLNESINSKAPFSRTPILPVLTGDATRSTIVALSTTGGKDRELKEMVDSSAKLIGGSNSNAMDFYS